MFFSSDVANPDTYSKLYADMEMYTTTQPQPDPERFLNQCVSWEIASKENKWLGRNVSRWSDPEADKAYKAAQNELDPVKRAALLIKVNEIFCEANVLRTAALAQHRRRLRQQPDGGYLGVGCDDVEFGELVSERVATAQPTLRRCHRS